MRPFLHPSLVNGRFGDPALYVDSQFEDRAILFDLGDIAALSPRKMQRIDHVFVSHTHIDHFIGFDRLLRLMVGREKTIHLYGPPGFIDQVSHKLQAYRWNLVGRYVCDLVFVVTEIEADLSTRTVRMRFKQAFGEESVASGHAEQGVVHREPAFRVSVAVLEHRTPSLAFAVQESRHVNIWKSRLAALGLPVGPWLRELKRAVLEGKADDHVVHAAAARADAGRDVALGTLREVLTVTAGQKIAYVTDAADTPANRAAIVALAREAGLLFIEAAFAEADTVLAADRAHLTTVAAGRIARAAGVRRIEPFHFSPRYAGEEERMLAEARAAFGGG
ncbi:MAG TPA: MBL fold metallo-hydrolase [Xanthobacteraceae bacterium]|nr:MBL fold metallo-hydrolase [Xanthobacteraceae bacterium]